MRIKYVKGETALYCRYSGQNEAQDCYVELDCESETLTADYSPEIGGAVTFSVWHSRTLQFAIPCLTDAAVNALLDEIAPLAERVIDGCSICWDGSNRVGRYSEDAEKAIEEIRALCDEADDDEDMVNVWEASHWLGGIGGWEAQCRELGIKATTTDEELSKIEDSLNDEARGEEIHVLEGLDRHLEWLRQESRDALPECCYQGCKGFAIAQDADGDDVCSDHTG